MHRERTLNWCVDYRDDFRTEGVFVGRKAKFEMHLSEHIYISNFGCFRKFLRRMKSLTQEL